MPSSPQAAGGRVRHDRRPPMDSSPTTRGRDAELATIGRVLGAARDGAGAIVLVEGAAGFGKTRLLAEAEHRAGEAGLRVCSAIAEPGDQVLPVVPMALLAAALAAEAPAAGAVEAGFWQVAEIEARLERGALTRPLLIALDDVQWADAGTLAALRVLPRRLLSLPIVWLLAYRPREASAELRAVADRLLAHGAERLTLRRLDEADVALVVADVVRHRAAPELLELAARAEGSPYLLVELLRGLLEEGLVQQAGGLAELAESRLPARVAETMRERLDRLPSDARRAARVAAVLGRWFGFDLLAEMLDVPTGAVLAPVDELVRSDLLTETADGRLGFRHDLLREAVRDTLPVSARRALQRQAADLMLAQGASSVQVAGLLTASADPGDRLAAQTLLDAADQLRTSDPNAAAELGHRALELVARDDPLRPPLVAQVALALHTAGRAEEGKAFADSALREVLAPADEAEIRFQIASMLWIPAEDRIESGRRALALSPIPPELRARHLARLIQNVVGAGRLDEAEALVAEAERAVADAGNPAAAALLDMCIAMKDYAEGHFLRALERQDLAATRGARLGVDLPERDAVRTRFLGPVEHPVAIVRACEAGLVSAQRAGQTWTAVVWEQQRAVALLVLGRLADAAAALEGLYDPEDLPRVLNTVDASGVVALGQAALHMGDTRQLAACVRLATATVEATGGEVRCQAGWLLFRHELARGDLAAARAALAGAGPGRYAPPRWPIWQDDLVWLARLAHASDDAALEAFVRDGAADRVARNPEVDAIATLAAHATALLDRDVAALRTAMAGLERTGRVLAHAFAAEDLGRLLIEQGAHDAGVDVLGAALDRYVGLGAAWDAGRVRQRLRAAGVHRRLGSPDARGLGWDALTDTERNVVRLVAEGRTNREVAEQLFVSPHTVGTHLRHAFDKLAVRSRVELARRFTEYGGGAG
jgi:DNA-binding CsgD family transcriptional regulator